MCNRGIAPLSQSDNPIEPHQSNQAVNLMDGPGTEAASAPGSNDDGPRLKFLCSFLGSIMPRPQDGKLRYVGGETRIVSLPREISCAELMHRMRELYEDAVGLKYQQLDEDLDALVSVVNDDDVTNMMEEYEKLGSGDGFTRLRIFLFSEPEQDSSSHYVDGDGIGTERRYVDALNNMDDASDFRRPPGPESPGMSPMDDLYTFEQFPNLRNVNVPPHMVSGQLQQLVSQRYSEMEAPWNPAYYSPSHHGQVDPRLADIPNLHSDVYETPNHERGWVLQHQLNSMVDEARTLVTGAGRLNDHYIVDGSGMNVPPGHGSIADVHQVPSNYHHHHRAGPELSTEVFHDQVMAAAPHKNIPPRVPGPVVWRNVQSSGHGSPSYEASTAAQHLNIPGSPRFFIGEDSQNPHIESSPKMMGLDEKIIADSKDGVVVSGSVSSNGSTPVEEKVDLVEPGVKDLHASVVDSEQLVNHMIPELVASMKKVALEGIEEVKAKAERSIDLATKDMTANELEPVCVKGDSEVGSGNGNVNTSKIEPTKAEAEAVARGLQTINNDDLEEIKELGSGTYGAVYHGKWRGSDVAIKRIKASCFAGKPSHRERLIADFWKEALILSSLHHPNVISFYGIVRDGPDGSLATVTEFMVNGSLKQFLQKKDRTIDRRKRLIIAMDAAFGMEYLHGKNIVHFDLKCENLLVNMRDPQRPVCKIGDLGLSKVKQCTLVSGGVRGTLPWMAPELLSGKCDMVTEKIDVYSFAIVMWELLTGDEPYADMHCAGIIGGIVNNTLRPQIPTWCDPEWKTLMQSCWASDPAERPSFSHISQKLRTMAAAINVK